MLMKPTDVLMLEHRVIEQVLDCLERMTDACAANDRLDGASARQALDFFRHFADGCHHHKEEGSLFPMLEARGFPREHGPTGVMRTEHEAGRWHLAEMRVAVDGAEAGAAEAVEKFLRHARSYLRLLREHIHKEDHCLFPKADQALSRSDQEAVLAGFGRTETEHVGAGEHEHYLQVADELAARWGVPRALAAAGHGCGACCHHGH
jgi:hemerythrin-like domain-containing protein